MADNNDEPNSAADDGPEPELIRVKATWKSPWATHKTLTYNCLKDFIHLHREPLRGTFGGRIDQPEKATGFFYVTRRLDNRWTLIDPEGFPFICSALNSVVPQNRVREYKEAFDRKYGEGDTGAWAKETYAYLFQELGITTLGCWSDIQTFHNNGIQAPYCHQWNFMLTYAGSRARLSKEGVIPVFDPGFITHCDERAKQLVATKDDPWLLGHFSDNELPLKETNIIKLYLKLDPEGHGFQAAAKWLEERNKTPNDITLEDNRAFATLVISQYYRIVSEAIKKYDPNHLYIGSRFHGGVLAQDCTFVACGPYVDVVSANYYHRWTPNQNDMNRWSRLSGRPVFPTEWYAKGEDSGIPNQGGAGFNVATQSDRGAFYENFSLSLMRNPNVVGWHWFRYIDSTGANAGLYDLQFNPWQPLAASFKTINSRLYSLSEYMATTKNPAFMDEDEIVPDKDDDDAKICKS